MTSYERVKLYEEQGNEHLTSKNYAKAADCFLMAVKEYSGGIHVSSKQNLDHLQLLDSACAAIEKCIVHKLPLTRGISWTRRLQESSKLMIKKYPRSARSYLRRAKGALLVTGNISLAIDVLERGIERVKPQSDFDKSLVSCMHAQLQKLRAKREIPLGKKTEINVLARLPEELLCHVFYYLDTRDILSCLNVSRRWAEILYMKPVLLHSIDMLSLDSAMKKSFYKHLNNTDLKGLSRSVRTVSVPYSDVSVVRGLHPLQLKLVFDAATLAKVPFMKFSSVSTMFGPRLTSLSLVKFQSSFLNTKDLENLLVRCPNLARFELSGAIDQLGVEAYSHVFPNLRHLKLQSLSTDHKNCFALTGIIHACPNLDTLFLQCSGRLDRAEQTLCLKHSASGLRLSRLHIANICQDLHLNIDLSCLMSIKAVLCELVVDPATSESIPLRTANFSQLCGERSAKSINTILRNANADLLTTLDIDIPPRGLLQPINADFWTSWLPRLHNIRRFGLLNCDLKTLKGIVQSGLCKLERLDVSNNMLDQMELSRFVGDYQRTTGSPAPKIYHRLDFALEGRIY